MVILHKRDLLRDTQKQQAQVNATSNLLKNRFNFGVSNSSVSAVLSVLEPLRGSDMSVPVELKLPRNVSEAVGMVLAGCILTA
jgi:hypothetical protein